MTSDETIRLPRDAVWMAVRYGRGRATYADKHARDILRAAWPHLTESERERERAETADYIRDTAPNRDAAILCGAVHHWRELYESMHQDQLPPELPGRRIFADWDEWETP